MRMRLGTLFVCGFLLAANSSGIAADEAIVMSEPSTDARLFAVKVDVSTKGKLKIAGTSGKPEALPLSAHASFQFRERRLPPAGRDALALRAVREFKKAMMTAEIEQQKSTLDLPSSSRVIVSSGRRSGLVNYAPTTPLTRDLVDLLDMPGDPLTLIGLLPENRVEAGSEWKIPEWAAQMLCGIEAVESAALSASVLSLDGNQATIELNGSVKGLREGAQTKVDVSGQLIWSVDGRHLSRANLTLAFDAEIGAVSPGIDAEVNVAMERTPTQTSGALGSSLLESIPLEPPETALELLFDAPPWQARFRHGRDWHLFQAVLDAPPKVAIFRLVKQGSLICQCNVSPIPSAPPGEFTPVETFANDIQTVLGKAFRGIKSQKVQTLDDGRVIVSVIVEGQVDVQGAEKAISLPMEWHYYLCASPRGQQMSFVFAVEPDLLESLGQQDLEFVRKMEFLTVRQARQ